MSATVEEFIAPGITTMSEKLNISESLAAVTLLALANGAGDVITAVVSSGAEGGVSYNVGYCYGSTFFVCSLVMSIAIFKTYKKAEVDGNLYFSGIEV